MNRPRNCIAQGYCSACDDTARSRAEAVMAERSTYAWQSDWYVVAHASDLAEGAMRQVTLLGEPIVLWRSAGIVRAFDDRCPHRGVPLTMGRVDAGRIVCPYHGWAFGVDGACESAPHVHKCPSARLRARAVDEHMGFIWVSLGDHDQDGGRAPRFRPLGDPSLRTIACGPYTFRTYGTRVMENFLDVTHLPHVHRGILGDPETHEARQFQVHEKNGALYSAPMFVRQPNPDGGGEPARVTYQYAVFQPLVAGFSKRYRDEELNIVMAITPALDARCTVWMQLRTSLPHTITDASLRAFQDEIVAQDVAIVESQRPQLIPPAGGEVHCETDTVALGYRRWLKRKGWGYGFSEG